jgi:hypothetical protein
MENVITDRRDLDQVAAEAIQSAPAADDLEALWSRIGNREAGVEPLRRRDLSVCCSLR